MLTKSSASIKMPKRLFPLANSTAEPTLETLWSVIPVSWPIEGLPQCDLKKTGSKTCVRPVQSPRQWRNSQFGCFQFRAEQTSGRKEEKENFLRTWLVSTEAETLWIVRNTQSTKSFRSGRRLVEDTCVDTCGYINSKLTLTSIGKI